MVWGGASCCFPLIEQKSGSQKAQKLGAWGGSEGLLGVVSQAGRMGSSGLRKSAMTPWSSQQVEAVILVGAQPDFSI